MFYHMLLYLFDKVTLWKGFFYAFTLYSCTILQVVVINNPFTVNWCFLCRHVYNLPDFNLFLLICHNYFHIFLTYGIYITTLNFIILFVPFIKPSKNFSIPLWMVYWVYKKIHNWNSNNWTIWSESITGMSFYLISLLSCTSKSLNMCPRKSSKSIISFLTFVRFTGDSPFV